MFCKYTCLACILHWVLEELVFIVVWYYLFRWICAQIYILDLSAIHICLFAGSSLRGSIISLRHPSLSLMLLQARNTCIIIWARAGALKMMYNDPINLCRLLMSTFRHGPNYTLQVNLSTIYVLLSRHHQIYCPFKIILMDVRHEFVR